MAALDTSDQFATENDADGSPLPERKSGWLMRHVFQVFPKRQFCVLDGHTLYTYSSMDTTVPPYEEFNLLEYRLKSKPDDPWCFYLEYRDATKFGKATPWVIYIFSGVSDLEYVEGWKEAIKSATINALEILREVETRDTMVSAYQMGAIEREIAPQVEEARQYTANVLNTPCSGVPGSQDTAIHVLSALTRDMGKEPLFFDGNACDKLPDSLTTPHIGFHGDTKTLDLHLNKISDIVGDDLKINEEELGVSALDIALKTGVTTDSQQYAIDTLRQKLARAHGVDVSCIEIKSFYDGSFAFTYEVNTKAKSVDDVKDSEVTSIQQVEDNLRQEFGEFKSLGIHPLFYRSYFDVGMFDPAGNKDFTNESGKYKLGSGREQQEYEQPTGWYGYGLKVLYPKTDKFGQDNTWLDPFQNPNMWHKAYHGTGSLKSSHHADKLPKARDDNERPMCGMASIHKNGMQAAEVAAYGPGVYCGKSVKFFTEGKGKSFLGETTIETKSGLEVWQFLVMVAIKPGQYDEKYYHDQEAKEVNKFYLVHKKEDVRPYRLLFRKKPGQ